MAEETSTSSSTSEATAADFLPEELEVPSKGTSTATKTPPEEPDEDEDIDFDPSSEEFEIPTPEKKEEKETTTSPSEEGGKKERSSPKDKPEEEVKPPPKSEEKPEKAPAPPNLVRVKIGDKEFEFPEESYDVISDTIKKAKEIEEKSASFSKNLLDKHSETYLDLLTEAYKGDRDAAYQHLIKEYAGVLKAEIERQNLPPEQREALEAKEKAQRLESELKQYREKEEAERKRIAEAREIESFMGEIVEAMKSMKLDLNDKRIKDIAFETLDNLKLLRSQGKNPIITDVVKYFKNESDKRLAEKDKEYEESLAEVPDEELFKRHQKLVDRLRKTDLAKHKEAATTAKTPQKPTGVERDSSQSSRKKILNSADWDKHFFGK